MLSLCKMLEPIGQVVTAFQDLVASQRLKALPAPENAEGTKRHKRVHRLGSGGVGGPGEGGGDGGKPWALSTGMTYGFGVPNFVASRVEGLAELCCQILSGRKHKPQDAHHNLRLCWRVLRAQTKLKPLKDLERRLSQT